MKNREAQNELCRVTKAPEEAYRTALSYERGINTPKPMLRPEAQRRAVPEAAVFKIRRSRWELFEVDIGAIEEEEADKRKNEDHTGALEHRRPKVLQL